MVLIKFDQIWSGCIFCKTVISLSFSFASFSSLYFSLPCSGSFSFFFSFSSSFSFSLSFPFSSSSSFSLSVSWWPLVWLKDFHGWAGQPSGFWGGVYVRWQPMFWRKDWLFHLGWTARCLYGMIEFHLGWIAQCFKGRIDFSFGLDSPQDFKGDLLDLCEFVLIWAGKHQKEF